MFRYSIVMYLLLVCQANATTFVPISIKKQIKKSGAIVQGEVLGLESIDRDGLIYTQVNLHLERWIGVEVKNNHISVFYPGGELGGVRQVVHGAPKLNLGEKVVLMLTLNKDEMWVNNLGLGKFSIKRVGKKEIIVNQIFPDHPDVGQMELGKFVKLSEWVKKQEFQKRFKDKYEINHEKTVNFNKNHFSNGRNTASLSYESDRENSEIPIYWLVILLGVSGVIFKLTRNRFL